MTVPAEVAAILSRLVSEVYRYEVDTDTAGEPWRVRRPAPASLPGYEHVGSYAEERAGDIYRTGPHATECAVLLDLMYDHWTAED